ncbi:Uncharacterized protein TCM_004493 [Theobroma cacao]|uniref:Uncharacterized protein n=1 Tax=Theobroma cacao TaxID=3641 RepID=A0A061DPZ6_THECC|nr:Uncharacterized protein TCM_004493 [Theobroma cacao]
MREHAETCLTRKKQADTPLPCQSVASTFISLIHIPYVFFLVIFFYSVVFSLIFLFKTHPRTNKYQIIA